MLFLFLLFFSVVLLGRSDQIVFWRLFAKIVYENWDFVVFCVSLLFILILNLTSESPLNYCTNHIIHILIIMSRENNKQGVDLFWVSRGCKQTSSIHSDRKASKGPGKKVLKSPPKKIQATLKDLCLKDRQKIANLIIRVAQVESEKKVCEETMKKNLDSALDETAKLRRNYEKALFEMASLKQQLIKLMKSSTQPNHDSHAPNQSHLKRDSPKVDKDMDQNDFHEKDANETPIDNLSQSFEIASGLNEDMLTRLLEEVEHEEEQQQNVNPKRIQSTSFSSVSSLEDGPGFVSQKSARKDLHHNLDQDFLIKEHRKTFKRILSPEKVNTSRLNDSGETILSLVAEMEQSQSHPLHSQPSQIKKKSRVDRDTLDVVHSLNAGGIYK